MRTGARGIRAWAVGGLAAFCAGVGLVAVAPPAGATSTFTLSRLAGNDRYLTASAIDQAAYPNGESTVLLADGVTGHQSDALAASGVEGVFGVGVLLTDNTNTVPSSTLTALSANKASKVVVVGGTGAVSQAQIDQLKADGYQVSTPYQGQTRWQTMQMLDGSMGGAGTDASGNATAVLASGNDAHLVDALAAGGLAYAKHFPIILTNSQGPGLQPEAQQVISSMKIKHLIVVGGPAAIPTSEYNPPPSGVTTVDTEYGADRSATSKVLADFAIKNAWLANTNLTLARGDDGADALAGSAFAGTHAWPTVVTNSPSDVGSATGFATEHQSTLAGTSYIFGGTTAVPDSQKSAVQTAGAGSGSTTAPAGAFGTAGGTSPLVTAESATTFSEGGYTYTYGSGDTYQIVTTSSGPNSSPACTPDSYNDFQARLSNGDSVSGTYQPAAKSTFCLNDVAPHPPASVSQAQASGGGVTLTWNTPPQAGTDGVTSYTVWREAATAQPAGSSNYTCTAAYTVAPGTSPQTPPSGYTTIATQPATSSATQSYTDPSATAGNQYCYAVSSLAPAASGNQTGTAQPASPSSLQASSPTAIAGSGTGGSAAVAPVSASTSYDTSGAISSTNLSPGLVLNITFSQPMTVATSWKLHLAQPCHVVTPANPPTTTTATGTYEPGDTCPYTATLAADPNQGNYVTLDPSNGNVPTVSGNTVSIQLSGYPRTGGSSNSTAHDVPIHGLQVVAESGFTSVPSSGGLDWNLPGSSASGSLSVNRVFDGTTANLPAAPTVYYVVGAGASSSGNTMSYRCSDPSSTQLNVYSQQGVLLAAAPCTSTGSVNASCPSSQGTTTQPTRTGVTPGAAEGQPSPFTFAAGITYQFTETCGAPGTNQESQSATATAGSSPPSAPALTSVAVASQQAATLTLTYNGAIACATLDTKDFAVSSYNTTTGSPSTATSYPSGSFVPSCPSSSPSTSTTVTLTPTAAAGAAPFPSGYTIVVTSAVGSDGDTVCTQASPNNTLCESVGDSKSATT